MTWFICIISLEFFAVFKTSIIQNNPYDPKFNLYKPDIIQYNQYNSRVEGCILHPSYFHGLYGLYGHELYRLYVDGTNYTQIMCSTQRKGKSADQSEL